MRTFPRYRWLPPGAIPFRHGEPRALPGGRYFGLGAATAVLVALPLELPRWAWPLIAAALAGMATLCFVNGRRANFPTNWLVREPDRIGLVHSGDQDRTGSAPGIVTWLCGTEIQLWQHSWAQAAQSAASRTLDAAGLVDPTHTPDWDEDEEEDSPFPGYVARDTRGAFAVPGYHLPPDSEDETGLLLFSWTGAVREQLRPQRREPAITRVTFDDVRALNRAGVAPAHRLEASFTGHAQPTEADLVLELGLPRGWASILDTLPPAEVRALPPAERLAVLRAEVIAQGERDLRWERERGVVAPVSPQWTQRWLRRLETLGAAADPAPELSAGAWPELTGTGRTAVLLAASLTDLDERPLRPALESLGVPTESAVEKLAWAPGHRLWQLLDRLNLGLCWVFVICASTSVGFWAQG